jgi:hypothetical protein
MTAGRDPSRKRSINPADGMSGCLATPRAGKRQPPGREDLAAVRCSFPPPGPLAVNHSSTAPQYVPGMDGTQTLAAQALRELLDPDRDGWDELVAAYRALIKAIATGKPMTRRNARLVAEYLREAGWRERPIGAVTTNARDYGRPRRLRGSRDCDAEAGAGDGQGAHPGDERQGQRCVNAWLHLFAICRTIHDWDSMAADRRSPRTVNRLLTMP